MAEIGGMGGALTGWESGPFSEQRIGRLGPGEGAKPFESPKGGETGASFLETLKGAFGDVNKLQVDADKAARDFSTGEGGNLHDVMIAAEKADIGLRTLTAVRNKVVEAYQEIMRLQV
jgi:flagellar hook-basal body complex protein FliE